MPLNIKFDFHGDVQVNRTFALMDDRTINAEPAFFYMYDFMRGVLRRQFRTGGARAGRSWKHLKPATVAAKRARGSRHANEILRDTDRLFRSVTSKGARDQVLRVTSDSMLFKTKTPYAAAHQKGGDPGPPQRRIFDFTKADRAEIPRILQGWIVAGRLNAGAFR